jgi:ATP-dependent DNA helicase DinG
MSTAPKPRLSAAPAVPAIPALWANARGAVMMTVDGEILELSHEKARLEIGDKPVLVCHAPYTAQRLGAADIRAFDLLELFAFVHPTLFCVPTPAGIAKALGVAIPFDTVDYPAALMDCARALLSDLRNDLLSAKASPLPIAGVMGQQGKGWPWTPFVFAALGATYDPAVPPDSRAALNIWKHLPEWSEDAPPPPPSHFGVSEDEARARLKQLVGAGAEDRSQQSDYSAFMAQAFAPLPGDNEDAPPQAVIAEAGTGVGKTLGYLAPASVWAEKNKGSVWISTYTKNLQRQIDQELSKLYPDKDVKDSKVAVRKGRENYLCLLNYEEHAAGAALAKHPAQAIAAGIMARWAAATREGDLTGADYPGWLSGLLGFQHTRGLADRRGECIYGACDHYHRCFVERSIRRAKHADIVVANHALVMIQTADSGIDSQLPKRYVFDEGHHLFDAADSAFAGHLTARETQDMRRWIRGAEGGRKSRARGLKRRLEELVAGDALAETALQDILEHARALTAEGWTARLKETSPQGPAEKFIAAVYAQVMARTKEQGSLYSLETDTRPIADGVVERGVELKGALESICKPMLFLAGHLRKRLAEQMDTMDSDTRKRIEAVCVAMGLRTLTLRNWIEMLETIQQAAAQNEFVDWMEIERMDGKAVDIGLYRHYINPMVPFAAAIKPHAHGMAVTSATLRDGSESEDLNWKAARMRTGMEYVSADVQQEKFSSPFLYAAQTRVLVVTDVTKTDLAQVAGAYQTLFEAAGGGALGLFTAISRLRAVQSRIAAPLEESGISLYAQHVDDIDNGTLVDIFRDDRHACLLGTDAVRDGVDVPGDSLRLIVFDRVPWPRPTILHRARKAAFGGQRYDDMIVRLKLKQAYGRLIRRADDRGVFVMLDPGLPSRLAGAFPETVQIQRVGIAEAADEVKKFLA